MDWSPLLFFSWPTEKSTCPTRTKCSPTGPGVNWREASSEIEKLSPKTPKVVVIFSTEDDVTTTAAKNCSEWVAVFSSAGRKLDSPKNPHVAPHRLSIVGFIARRPLELKINALYFVYYRFWTRELNKKSSVQKFYNGARYNMQWDIELNIGVP